VDKRGSLNRVFRKGGGKKESKKEEFLELTEWDILLNIRAREKGKGGEDELPAYLVTDKKKRKKENISTNKTLHEKKKKKKKKTNRKEGGEGRFHDFPPPRFSRALLLVGRRKSWGRGQPVSAINITARSRRGRKRKRGSAARVTVLVVYERNLAQASRNKLRGEHKGKAIISYLRSTKKERRGEGNLARL